MDNDTGESAVRNPRPGDVFFDRTGFISHSVPATYVVLSGERSNERIDGWEYRCWCARACDGLWMGGPVVIMWDTDLAGLELVNRVPMDHLANDGAHTRSGAE